MNKWRLTFKSLTIGLLALLAWRCQDNAPPNFVFVLVDDLGYKDLSCYGSTLYETPHLDQLAKTGVRFTSAYASCPVCSPTRASIMTGKHPTTLNITDWIPGQDRKDQKLLGPQDLHALPASEMTIAEQLKQSGYRTFFAGKWHLGGEGSYPEDHGFDINMGGHDKGSPPGGYYSPYKNPKLSDGPEGEYLPDRLTNESIAFLNDRGDEPFLLFLSYYTVHTPIQASTRHVAASETRARQLGVLDLPKLEVEGDGVTVTQQYNADYASMVEAMDENIGRLLASIKESDLNKNTIVIVTSDNGGLSTLYTNRTAPTSVRPLRGGKGWCYEGGIRVPLIIRAPGLSPAEIDEPVSSIDFYPTMLELAKVKSTNKVDGVSMVSLLQDKQPLGRDALFWHYPHYHGSAWTPGAAIRMDNHKLVEFYEDEIVELYDLKADPAEKNDLAETNPELVKKLRSRLQEMQHNTGAKFPTNNPNYGITE